MEDLIELEKQIEERKNAPIEPTTPINDVSLENLNEEYLKNQVSKGKSVTEIATDYAKAKTTMEIIKNKNGEYDKLHKEFREEERETLLQGYKQDRIRSQTKTLSEKQKKAEAFYVSFRPILEFDFSNLIHKKKVEETSKTYADRSYGIPLMVLMLCLFTIPYCFTSLILAFFNSINAICEAICSFSTIAKSIVLSIFVIFMAILVVYFALLGIDALFGTSIIQYLKL